MIARLVMALVGVALLSIAQFPGVVAPALADNMPMHECTDDGRACDENNNTNPCSESTACWYCPGFPTVRCVPNEHESCNALFKPCITEGAYMGTCVEGICHWESQAVCGDYFTCE